MNRKESFMSNGNRQIDQEWLQLIKEAKELGLTMKNIQDFLKQQKVLDTVKLKH